MNKTLPTRTPNVVIKNPTARKVAGTILDVTGLIIGSLVAIDIASDNIDWEMVTAPALAAWTYLRASFGLIVTNPNTPSEPVEEEPVA